jgi:hypothetical protein
MAQRVARSNVRVAIRTRPTAAWDQDELFVDPANAHVQVHHVKEHKDAVSNAQEDWSFKYNYVLHNSTQCVTRAARRGTARRGAACGARRAALRARRSAARAGASGRKRTGAAAWLAGAARSSDQARMHALARTTRAPSQSFPPRRLERATHRLPRSDALLSVPLQGPGLRDAVRAPR